jgi:DNA invertase Pin-like site-specific DNA recombinase
VFNGEVKTVVVYKLDRISRRLKDGVNTLADWCEKGVRVVVVTQAIDLSGPVGRMIAAVLMGLSEVELEFRRERQAAGIEVAKRKGVYRGRKRGTTKSKPDRAAALKEKGLTVPEIATALGTSERTIFRYLNPLMATTKSVWWMALEGPGAVPVGALVYFLARPVSKPCKQEATSCRPPATSPS